MDRKSIGNTVMLKEHNRFAERKELGIFIPDISQKDTKYWKVVGLGTGCLDKNGVKVPFKVDVDDLVIIDIKNHVPTTVLWEDNKLLVINQNAVIAKVNKND